ncbi:FixH family protein [Gallaecimonas kandeliae]|uniref:FixH family protein n=1 Tax=Gallaecimonas kandeliae TaxID=3029055 RepID=UPI0026499AE8|nr:FixH family protein [Gallaecimonas kandeliae]WKE67328.1 FixH family protein [Gallaecimonas kandeliae]
MQPWYKQFWPWFLMFLPACAVVTSLYTFYIAASHPPDMVVDDYYKKGQAINRDLTELNAAYSRHIQARLDQGTAGFELVLSGKGIEPGQPLKLNFHHATLASKDFSETLTADAHGHYRFTTAKPIKGHWHLRLEPLDGRWRVQTLADFDEEREVVLTGEP